MVGGIDQFAAQLYSQTCTAGYGGAVKSVLR